MYTRIARPAAYLALVTIIVLATGCMEFFGNEVDQPTYGVPGEELPIKLYVSMPEEAQDCEGYVYIQMRNNWTIKNDTMDYTSEERVLSGQLAYNVGRRNAARTEYGREDGGNDDWWGGVTDALTVNSGEEMTITGYVVVDSSESAGTYDIDYALGEDPDIGEEFTGGAGQNFNNTIIIGDVRVAMGDKAPADKTATSSQQNVVITQFKVRVGAPSARIVNGLTFTHQGTANAMNNVSSARLYRDNNNDGKLQGGGDTLLATDGTPGTTMAFSSFTSAITAGTEGNFLLVYDFSSATNIHTYSVRTSHGSSHVSFTTSPTIAGPADVDSNVTTISDNASLSVEMGAREFENYQVVAADAQDKTLLHLAFTAGGADDVTITSMTITFTDVAGEAFETDDVTDLRIYRDNDNDGYLDAGDPQASNTQTWTRTGADTNIAFTLSSNNTVQKNSTVSFIVVIDLSGNASDSENIMARLTGSGNISAQDQVTPTPNSVTCTGSFPIGGTRTDVHNDLVINLDEDGVVFTEGPQNPGDSERTRTDTGIIAMQTSIQAPNGQKATINDLVVGNYGTITGVDDVSAVRLYRDFNADGEINGSDYEVANAAFDTYPPAATDDNGCRIELATAYDIPAGEEHTFLIVLDLNGAAAADETIILRLLDPSDYTDIASDVTVGTTPDEANLYTGPVLQESGTITLKDSSLNVVEGDDPPPAQGIADDQQKVAVLQFKLTAGALANVTVTEIKVDGAGTGDNANDITYVHLYNDLNANGEYDSGIDQEIKVNQTYSSDVVTFGSLSEQIDAGETEHWLVVYDMAGSADDGETFTAQVASSSSITCSGTVAVSGPPVTSSTVTVQGVGTLTFTAGANPADGPVDQAATEVVVLNLLATANDIEDIEITAMTLTQSGTATNADLVNSSIKLYHDVDGDGALTGADVQVGSSLSDPAAMTFTFGVGNEVTVTAGEAESFILLVDVENAATVGDTIRCNLDLATNVTATGVDSSSTANRIGAPTAGTLTITNVATLAVSQGDANPGASSVLKNEQDVGMVQIKLTTGSAASVTVTGATFRASGDADDQCQADGGDLANDSVDVGVSLYVDANDNGQYDSGETRLGSSSYFSDNDGTVSFTFSRPIPASTVEHWVLVYDLRNPGTATNGETFQAIMVDPTTDVTATGVTPTGPTVSGGIKTVTDVTAITWNGDVSANFNLPGNYDEDVAPGPGIDVTVPNEAVKPIISADGEAKTLTINASSSVTVQNGKALNCYGNLTLNGTLELQANSTLRMSNGSTLTGGANSTFKVSGTGQTGGGYATIEALSGSYGVVLNRHVDVTSARFYDLNSTGVTLAATSTTTIFNNVLFYDGAAGATPYLRITGAAWNSQTFKGLGFDDVGGAKTHAIQITTGGNVAISGYGAGGSWLSGDATDIESSGNILWSPSAAEGLEARVTNSGRGSLITWTADVERNTAGYRLLRRQVTRYASLLIEESGSAAVHGDRREIDAGKWQELTEIPATMAGISPRPTEYTYLDRDRGEYQYLVEEVETNGNRGSRVRAIPGGAAR